MGRIGWAAALAAATGVISLALSVGPGRGAGGVPVCSTVDPIQKTVNLTGIWTANDGGTYWMRQIGSCLWWTGFSGPVDTATMGKSFSNVLYGTVKGTTIYGYWADVPRAGTVGSGTLVLRFNSSAASKRIYKLSQMGSAFSGSSWTLSPKAGTITRAGG